MWNLASCTNRVFKFILSSRLKLSTKIKTQKKILSIKLLKTNKKTGLASQHRLLLVKFN